MPTFTALTTLVGQDSAEALAEAMEGMTPEPLGLGVFEIEDDSGLWEVGAYFTEAPDEATLLLLAAAFAAKPFVVSELPEVDWVAKVKRDLSPVTAGRFFLYGSHDADRVPPDVVPLLIEATVAFGTGHHGTTLGCLRALDRLVTAGEVAQNVADIGSGTGVLAMAAAKVWPSAVLASDIDPISVEVSDANAKLNGVFPYVLNVQGVGFDNPYIRKAAPFDLIIANILAGPLKHLAPEMRKHCMSGGLVLLSGILATQANSVIASYRSHGFVLQKRSLLNGWATLVLQKA